MGRGEELRADDRLTWGLAWLGGGGSAPTPNPPTDIIPSKIARLRLSGRFPMGLGIPPLNIKMLPESNPLKSIMLVGRLAVRGVGTLRYLLILSENSACRVPICAAAARFLGAPPISLSVAAGGRPGPPPKNRSRDPLVRGREEEGTADVH